MSENFDVVVIYVIHGQFGAIQKPDSGRIDYKNYIFHYKTYYLTKTDNRTKKSLLDSTIALSKGTIFLNKRY